MFRVNFHIGIGHIDRHYPSHHIAHIIALYTNLCKQIIEENIISPVHSLSTI